MKEFIHNKIRVIDELLAEFNHVQKLFVEKSFDFEHRFNAFLAKLSDYFEMRGSQDKKHASNGKKRFRSFQNGEDHLREGWIVVGIFLQGDWESWPVVAGYLQERDLKAGRGWGDSLKPDPEPLPARGIIEWEAERAEFDSRNWSILELSSDTEWDYIHNK